MRTTVSVCESHIVKAAEPIREGPIIRINPHEIHINDPEYIDEVYAGSSKKRDKYRWMSRMTSECNVIFCKPCSVQFICQSEGDSTVTTIPHDLHRKRRVGLNAFFSKMSIRRLEPMILDTVAQLLNRMDVCGRSGEVMQMNMVYKALTSDIITRYAFGNPTNYLSREDYNSAYFQVFENCFEYVHWLLHIGWLGSFLESLPIEIVMMLTPEMGSIFKLRVVNCAVQILT